MKPEIKRLERYIDGRPISESRIVGLPRWLVKTIGYNG